MPGECAAIKSAQMHQAPLFHLMEMEGAPLGVLLMRERAPPLSIVSWPLAKFYAAPGSEDTGLLGKLDATFRPENLNPSPIFALLTVPVLTLRLGDPA